MRITREQPGPRQLQEHVQQAWQDKQQQQQQDETSGTSGVSEGQCPQQLHGYVLPSARQREALSDSVTAGLMQHGGQHNKQEHAARDVCTLEMAPQGPS
jgi:hypothetical protein